MDKKTIGFIGMGNMGKSIYQGLGGSYKKIAYDIVHKEDSSVEFVETMQECIEKSDILLIAVKPNQVIDVLKEIQSPKIIFSIAAGIGYKFIKNNTPIGSQVVRTMPNLPILVGRGVIAYYGDKEAYNLVESLFDSIALTVRLDKEEQMDAITGLSGSGPAFVFSFLQAMAEGGVKSGLNYKQALEIASETIQGSIQYFFDEFRKNPSTHPMELRNRVTSPGGTTIFGVAEWERAGVHSGILESVYQASLRSKNLS
jgi:pyrroline-5-carboxylate reductase